MTLDTKALEAAYAALDGLIGKQPTPSILVRRGRAEIAHAAITAYLSQAATPSRNDILEEAARVADDSAEAHGRLSNHRSLSIATGSIIRAETAQEIAAAIRALVKP